MLIRLAEVNDAGSIARIQVNGWHEAYQAFMPPERLAKMTVDARGAIWQKVLAEGVTLVAENDVGITGFCSIGSSRDDDSDAAIIGEIYALYVEPVLWRAGIGSALVSAALRRLRDSGFLSASLWVLRENTIGRRFYEKLGFEPDGKTKLFQSGGKALQELRYIIRL